MSEYWWNNGEQWSPGYGYQDEIPFVFDPLTPEQIEEARREFLKEIDDVK